MKWYFNNSVDLERWLPCITTSPLEGQDNPAYKGEGLICAFDKEFIPEEKHRALIIAAPELLEQCEGAACFLEYLGYVDEARAIQEKLVLFRSSQVNGSNEYRTRTG